MQDNRDPHDPRVRADALVSLFCSPEEFGRFRSLAASEVPEPARTLLDHCNHMTVAMEQFHGGEVRLRVVATAADSMHGAVAGGWYAREILLENQRGEVVQYGIVRIDLSRLGAREAAAIREARRPLGRILIESGLLREVHGVRLLEVVPGPHLERLFGLQCVAAAAEPVAAAPGRPVCRPVYGRVANIQLNDRPAVELLELVSPAF